MKRADILNAIAQETEIRKRVRRCLESPQCTRISAAVRNATKAGSMLARIQQPSRLAIAIHSAAVGASQDACMAKDILPSIARTRDTKQSAQGG